eukprot:4753891-Amphidinium_carterae.3
MVQEPPPRCCPRQAMLQLEALRRERKSGVQERPVRVSSSVASRSAQRRAFDAYLEWADDPALVVLPDLDIEGNPLEADHNQKQVHDVARR